MKGVVFTEFMDFVAAQFDDDMVDDIVADSNLPSGGAYTAVGTYDFREMQALVTALAQRSGHGVPSLLATFGRHLCGQFQRNHAEFFERMPGLFDFLESVDRHIHVEVHKLYPDAQLPSFETQLRDPVLLELKYRSCRPLASLAEGLILGASDYYAEPVHVTHEARSDDQGAYVSISVRRVA
jgi:hypothetical protein